MRKVALVFVVAVILPSLVLAWLAVRSLRDQQFVLERQQSLLYQGVADSLADEIARHLEERQREFALQVEQLVADQSPREFAPAFDKQLRERWPFVEVGFVVTVGGNFLCPSPTASPEARLFCMDNGAFLGNREVAEVYWNSAVFQTANSYNAPQQADSQTFAQHGAQQEANNSTAAPERNNLNIGKIQNRKVNPVQQLQTAQQGELPPSFNNVSKVVPAEAEFHQLMGDSSDGMLARFLQNKLKLMFWHRLQSDPQLIFGAQLDLQQVVEGLSELVRVEPVLAEEICVVLLDDNARPVSLSIPEFQTDWKRPFVATEIGEALPHWEMAVYLTNPARLTQAAQTAKLTLGLLIGTLVLAIGVGSWLIVSDVNRQLRITRQKTDFVSNVSHELKTPLTSIRMFSELLVDGKVTDREKQRSYLQIIAAESARLTRLINNVLDFARIERGEKKYNFTQCDLQDLLKDTVETYRPHLESNGFTLDFQPPSEAVAVRADRDALSQVVVNLLSNAEKYSNGTKEIAVRAESRAEPVRHVEVQVLDRGPGVPRGCEEKIFEQFYRADDSLSNGAQGSGLGLTLARQIARAHGGDVIYKPREGGGSCFTLTLPVASTSRV